MKLPEIQDIPVSNIKTINDFLNRLSTINSQIDVVLSKGFSGPNIKNIDTLKALATDRSHLVEEFTVLLCPYYIGRVEKSKSISSYGRRCIVTRIRLSLGVFINNTKAHFYYVIIGTDLENEYGELRWKSSADEKLFAAETYINSLAEKHPSLMLALRNYCKPELDFRAVLVVLPKKHISKKVKESIHQLFPDFKIKIYISEKEYAENEGALKSIPLTKIKPIVGVEFINLERRNGKFK